MLSSSFKSYARQLRQLHALIRSGHGDGEQADNIRDTMDGIWASMDSRERSLTRVLSSDLYELGSKRAPEQTKTAEQKRKLTAIEEANRKGDADFVLNHLREIQRLLWPDFVAYLRGRSWSELGDNDTGILFMDHAAELAPGNVNFKYFALDMRSKSVEHRDLAEQQVAEILKDPTCQAPKMVAKAADIEFLATRQMEPRAAGSVYDRLIEIYKGLIPRLREGPTADKSVLVQVLVLKGLCHEQLGQTEDAMSAFTEALQIDHQNESALTARGLLGYGQSQQAIHDLEKASRLGAVLVWPYFLLAHHAISHEEYKSSTYYAKLALEHNPTRRLKADLFEWLAISSHELGAPSEQVEELFNRALEIEPGDARIEKNLARFREISKGSGEPTWASLPDNNTIRELGRASFVEEYAAV